MNNYLPYNQQPFNQFNRMTYPQNNGIQWVQGIEGAKAFQLMPNSNAQLLDSENDGIFYIKISDNVGMCTLRTFRYEEITEQAKQQTIPDLSEYVKKSELEELLKSVLTKGEQTDEQTVPVNAVNNDKPKSLFS